MDTAYWAEQFQKWWDEIGSKQKRARIPNELKEGYRNAAIKEIAKGKSPTPLTYREGREAFIEARGPGQGLKVVYKDTRTTKANVRRAEEKGKTITKQQRIDWYKRNLYNNPVQRGTADFEADKKARAAVKRAAELSGGIYEHLSPLNVPEQYAGGFESARNVVPAPSKENAIKSDKVASRQVLRQQGVPLTRSGAIRADARNIPLPGTPQTRFGAVYQDVVENNRPTARSLKQNPVIMNSGIARLNLTLQNGTPVPIQPTQVLSAPPIIRSKPKPKPKRNVRTPRVRLRAGSALLEMGEYTGSDTMPWRVNTDPLGDGLSILLP